MPSFSEYGSLTSELLKSKMESLLKNIDSICKEIGPQIEVLGKNREEVQLIYQELHKRGELPKYTPPLNEEVTPK